MASYTFKSWETINLDPVVENTTFRILDHIASESPATEASGVIYDGLIISQYNLQNLNEILSPYQTPYNIEFESSLQENFDAIKTYYIYYTTDDWLSYVYDEITIIYDWSYDDSDRSILSYPISNLIDVRQYFLYSVRPSDIPTELEVKINNYVVESNTLDAENNYNFVQYIPDIKNLPGEFNFDFSYDYRITSTNFKPGTFYNLTIGSNNFVIAHTCYRYCIYYFNQYGGWDSLLFEGKTTQTDNISRFGYNKEYVSQSLDFNKTNYLTTIKEKWELNTSFLDDLNSEKIINIMGSNILYLHDLEENKIIPVTITNSSCTHKTYVNQGRKLYNYTISVESSQPKYRM